MALRLEPLPESISDAKAPAYALRNLLWRWWVSEEVIVHFATPRPNGKGCQFISDFASLYTDATYEAKLKAAVSALENFKDDEVEVSRLRAAWGVARGQLIRTFENAHQGIQGIANPDLGAPLSTSGEKERTHSFFFFFPEAYPG